MIRQLSKIYNHVRRVGLYRTRTTFKILVYRYVYDHHIGNAFHRLQIDPSDIEYYLPPRFGPDSYVFDIKDGNWDQTRPQPIKEYDMYLAFKDRFVNDASWQQTKFYERIASEIEQGQTKWGCTSEKEFEDVCADFDRLHDSILEHGFLSMKELHECGLDSNRPIHAHEVCIVIGCDGTIYSDEGRHRLFIAKTLGVDEIPARVLVRHKSWQRIRDQVVTQGSLSSRYENHPDLTHLN